ncbi:MAG: hypothetical protein H5T63_03505, partial [Chloroflexi bacterium]|nr:hypothetical protein [Chloroflexota bacterium]
FVVFALLFGTELLVGKAVTALCYALTCVLSCRVARQLGLDRTGVILVLGALLVWRQGGSFSYTPLVYFFLLAALHAILLWQRSMQVGPQTLKDASTMGLVIAGVSAGLGFASKQSVGTYTLVAVCLSIAVGYYESGADKRQVLRAYALFLSVCFLMVGVVLLPVWLSGGAQRLVEYGVLGMQSYVRVSIIPYHAQLELLARLIAAPKPWGRALPITWQLAFLLPFPTVAVLVWLWLRSDIDRRRLITILLLFMGAAFAGVFPRVDIGHMIPAVPVFVLGLVWGCEQILSECKGCWLKVARTVFLLGFATAIACGLIANILWVIPRPGAVPREPSTLPHFRGILMQADYVEGVRSQAESLKQYTDGEPTFILNPSAAFYYLLTGIKNPTPYDFPFAGAFGLNGEAEVIEAIQQGRIRYVCITPLAFGELTPIQLERYVLEHMEPTHDVGFCTLYRRPQCSPEE